MKKLLCKIIAFSITHKFSTFVMILGIVIGGVYSFLQLPIEAYPDVTNTNVIIITQWPGRGAEEMERFVSIPIELEMNSIPKKTALRSISLFGLSYISIIFDDDVSNFEARTEVFQRLSNVDFPDNARPVVQAPSGPTGEIFRFTLASNSKNSTELKTIEDWTVEKQIKAVPGVAEVVSFGGRIKTFEVILSPSLLSKYSLTAQDVYEALKKSNKNVSGNVIRYGTESFVVRGIGLVKNIEDISHITVKHINNVPIRVQNVATVRQSFYPRLGIVGRDSLDDVVEGIILMRKGEDPTTVLKAVKEKINELNTSILPKDVKIIPFYDRTNLNNYTLHTVGENVIIGITLVTVILFIFILDIRITLSVAVVIPLALLFAFILMHLKGMRANLLSIGAIDFGIIIDGSVVMIEGLFVMLATKAHKLGKEKYKKIAKISSITHTATELGKSIFVSKLIIIIALLPIFSFQKVEGKLFSPLAFTIGFALLGALIVSLTLIPLLTYLFFKDKIVEKDNPLVNKLTNVYKPVLEKTSANPKITLAVAIMILAASLFSFKFLGSEFLPHLNEGSIYVRATMPLSVSLEESYFYCRKFRAIIKKHPEVRKILSQTGRPNDGTDPTGFFNIELFVDLYPEKEWTRDISKEELVSEMQKELNNYPGIIFNFSQPISDNVEESVAGVKGSIALKIFGKDLKKLDSLANISYNTLKGVEGISDLGILRNLGQPELDITLDPQKMAVYDVATEDCQSAIEMAIGGKAVNQVYEGEKRFDMVVRYDELYRSSETKIKNLLIPSMNDSTRVPLSEVADIKTQSGPAFIYREDNKRFIAIKFSVRNRDLGSTIDEARAKISQKIHLQDDYKIIWKGEFENQQRAEKRLSYVVPLSIIIIFIMLYISFGNFLDASLILLNVPFSLIGGIIALFVTGINFSISAGVGFIALFGVSVQSGVILVNSFKLNLENGMSLNEAVRTGALQRLRPVVITALMAALGLLPAAISTGIGSETQKPLAVVVIGGLISSTFLVLIILPVIFTMFYSRKNKKKTSL